MTKFTSRTSWNRLQNLQNQRFNRIPKILQNHDLVTLKELLKKKTNSSSTCQRLKASLGTSSNPEKKGNPESSKHRQIRWFRRQFLEHVRIIITLRLRTYICQIFKKWFYLLSIVLEYEQNIIHLAIIPHVYHNWKKSAIVKGPKRCKAAKNDVKSNPASNGKCCLMTPSVIFWLPAPLKYFPSGMEYMYEYIEAYTPKSTPFHRQRTGAGCPGWRCRSCPSGPCSCTPSGPTCPGTLPQPSVHLCLSYLVNIRDDEFRNVINDKNPIYIHTYIYIVYVEIALFIHYF